MAAYTGNQLYEKQKVPLGAQPPQAPAPVDPMSVSPSAMNRTDYWRNTGTTDNPMGKQTEQVINSGLSGQAFDPMRIQAQEALARAEANQRANTAAQIHSAGFSGTPLGAGMGNATEAALLRNRFDTNIGIEAADQQHRLNAADTALGYADQTNRFAMDQERFGLEKDAYQNELYNQSRDNLFTAVSTNPQWLEAMNSGDPMAAAGVMNDPVFSKVMQDNWERSGGQGQFTQEWAMQQLNSVADQNNKILQEVNTLTQLGLSREDAESLVRARYFEGLGIREDENGDIQIIPADEIDAQPVDWNTTNPFYNNDAKAILNDPAQKGSQEYNNVISGMAARLKSGEASPQAFAQYIGTDALPDIVNQLKGSGLVETGPGVKNRSGTNSYPALEKARDNNTFVEINGIIGYVTGRTKKGTWPDPGYYVYTVTSLGGGTVEYSAK